MKVIEITPENEDKYLDGIVNLENSVYENMIKQGKSGQLFTTGREDISSYIHSSNNSVFVIEDEENDHPVVAATYITQGQIPYTYNDVTKYYKCSPEYASYVRAQYESNEKYISDLRKVYTQKITAFVYSRDFILTQRLKERGINVHSLSEDDRNRLFLELVQAEIDDPENNFHEKSKIRDDLNKYMSLYMDKIYRDSDLYDRFYWADFDYIRQVCNSQEADFSGDRFDSTIKTYDEVLKLQKHEIKDKSEGLSEEQYYGANTDNTIELDTYITSDSAREFGYARIIVFEGLKKIIERQKMDDSNDSIFLVSTLHRDNLSSKYVSEFFGLKDNLFVKRRTGRDREVHICRIEKSRIKEYLSEIEKKLAVLYRYNPNNIQISNAEKLAIYGEQLEYEKAEFERLERLKNPKYEGYRQLKEAKISRLKDTIAKHEGSVPGTKSTDDGIEL